MKKVKRSKLKLVRETIRALAPPRLGEIRGAVNGGCFKESQCNDTYGGCAATHGTCLKSGDVSE